MNIVELQCSIETSSFEIYLAGCKPPHCPGCHNEKLHDFSIGSEWSEWKPAILLQLEFLDPLIEGVWVLGGEPLDQPLSELRELLMFLREHTDKPIWLFTHYNMGQIPCSVLSLCDYVKTGRYKPDLGPGIVEYGIQMATANQHVTRIFIPNTEGCHNE